MVVKHSSLNESGLTWLVSPRESAMKELLNHMQAKDVNILAMVGGGKGEVLRIKVAETFPDTAVMNIGMPTGAIIGVIRRGKGIIIPNGSTMVQAHDQLKIFTVPENTEPIKNIFAK